VVGEPGGSTEQAPVCATCGTVAADPALAAITWTRGTENGREVWTCDRCSREHLRSIEGKLDSGWW
jgi:hypothetical protein